MTPQITEKQSGCFDVAVAGETVGFITDMHPIACRSRYHATAEKPGRPCLGLFESLEAAAEAILADHLERLQ